VVFIEEHPLFLPAQFFSPSPNCNGHFEASLRGAPYRVSYGKGFLAFS